MESGGRKTMSDENHEMGMGFWKAFSAYWCTQKQKQVFKAKKTA